MFVACISQIESAGFKLMMRIGQSRIGDKPKSPRHTNRAVATSLAVYSVNRNPLPNRLQEPLEPASLRQWTAPMDWRKHGNAVKLSPDLLRST